MEIKFADSFFESLERLSRRERWYWKCIDFFRYDFPKGVKNLIYFFPVIWKFRGWDYSFNLELLLKSLYPLRDSLLNGLEVEKSRLKKVAAINRAIQILENITQSKYIEIAEGRLGKKVDSSMKYIFGDEEEPEGVKLNNREIFSLANKIEKEEWDELWVIFKGQDYKTSDGEWEDFFDGSGINGWWD